MRIRKRRRGGVWRVERAIYALNGQRVLGWLVAGVDLAWWEARPAVQGPARAPLGGWYRAGKWRVVHRGLVPAPVDYGLHVSITPHGGISPDLAWDVVRLVGDL